jgi:1-acyl-sn-glycerol-3-phosphate acyltransferase
MINSIVAGLSRLACGPTVVWHCDPDARAQRIYFANHSSHLDFVVLWASLPSAQRRAVRPIAGRDYWERTRVRRYVSHEVFRAILVDRPVASNGDRVAAAREAVAQMAQHMGDDTSLIVFPEGTRSVDGRVGPFKSGLYHLSRLKPVAELVPVYLHNLNRILPRGESLPVPMLSRVTFGAPFSIHPAETKDVFLERARSAVIELGEGA